VILLFQFHRLLEQYFLSNILRAAGDGPPAEGWSLSNYWSNHSSFNFATLSSKLAASASTGALAAGFFIPSVSI
jgi:hypothetical protein